ncbi:MAG: Asp-tRNA(Asn)/Glu-tRNA(Gln) amidotransferase subunit GatA [Flavobacteriales bacterium]|nr:Asp-tRNA(Asn)/Glu-tRNA(Gln) amidotransferase subunit GatA [Flavobacteriales bacterium]MBK6944356.1 Asp-tRNA(Asn)/Glu-tRNA(Gln) amidotransferase subunit GatA [Flavobacteriales bacterium]MBK7242100.1 Asp-tRNA(Asn)/Glu-tRNA(Gln) amidotransferase subunit GatA [Flavobacteriales bacterium]MBK7295141.1 Asp-tRNA(Asn)/Glu-tRNA(Gln) amidotransferase subunit GatA [Flavobacteriales bacterium]MBK9534023.1 Asp-tRNA(Asn)/Glu-tRNA(Gln) amidotransferase subunit GatA [Flavobacteriales bacterium]
MPVKTSRTTVNPRTRPSPDPVVPSTKTFSEEKEVLSKGGSVLAATEAALASAVSKKDLNAFLELFPTSAIAQAEAVDSKRAAGKAGPLAGMVISIKDNLCYKDHMVSASSKMLQGFTSLYTATAVERLLAADAVIIGRTNCDEFAMGSSNENSAFGNVKNPVNTDMVPGGSSGGAAASVAADIVHVALGSDTGGSIRQPASFTGTIGFKPTYGRVSRYGLIAFASSFDQIGPFAHTVDDVAAVYQVMAGHDPKDSTTSRKPVEPVTLADPGKLRIGYFREGLERDGMDPEVVAHLKAQIDRLKAEGHTVEPVEIPLLDHQVPAYYILATAEASSNLARFDGIHYGHRSTKAKGVEETYRLSRSEGFGPEVQRRILLGTFVLSAGYYDAYYAQAQRVRRIIRDRTIEACSTYDILLGPTCPGTAFAHGAVNDPIAMYLQDIFTVQANLAGVPAISLPTGTHSNGLPYGIQLTATPFAEAKLLAAAKRLF